MSQQPLQTIREVKDHSFIFEKLVVTADGNEVNDWSASEGDLLASDDESNVNLPTEYSMEAAYPNPFNPSTTVSVSLPDAADLTAASQKAA